MTPIRLRIKELREARGWSQKELGDRADVRQATISAMERAQSRGVDFDVLERLAIALGVNAAVLIDHVSESAEREGKRKGRN